MNPATAEHEPTIETPPPGACFQAETGARILVVEDSMVEQMRLATMLQKFGYEVITASDGQAAIEILLRHPIRLLVSDWRMPNMSGLELCREIRRRSEFGHPYFILVTGYDSKNDLIAGMDAGADDFISKPYNAEELRVRVQAGARIVNLQEQAEEKNAEMARVLAREAAVSRTLQADLEAAAIMQRSILPSNRCPLPGLEANGLFMPATTVAGDGYNFYPLDDYHLAFYHIDVSGHGAASAMLSFTIAHFLLPESGLVRMGSRANASPVGKLAVSMSPITSPEKVVTELNQLFVEKERCTRYFTMVYGVLDTLKGVGQICQAGHPHPLLVDASGNVRRLGKGGMPVGMLAKAQFESLPFRLETGETLFLYSDGVPDSTNADGEAFGLARLEALLRNIHERPLDEQINLVTRQMTEWHAGSPIDDISMLALSRLPLDSVKE